MGDGPLARRVDDEGDPIEFEVPLEGDYAAVGVDDFDGDELLEGTLNDEGAGQVGAHRVAPR